MAEYKIAFKASVDKDLTNLPKNLVARVWRRVELLKQQPFPKQAVKLEGSEGLYRLSVAAANPRATFIRNGNVWLARLAAER